MEVTPDGLARFFEVVLPHMNEVQRRVVAGAAAEMFGRGGKTAVATASGMSRNTVIKAASEVAAGVEPSDRLRAVGGGDKPLIDKQPGLLAELDELVHPDTRGNPMSLLRWTSKSSTQLA
ncbi:MAG: ISAzo13 family transposase, partial [Actinomycetia bacterium]|nr:ISAzo13 family transposase [Actinomycetes bacterium]